MESNGKQKKSKTSDLQDALELGGRIPPQAMEVEEAVLGSMLIDLDAANTALYLLKANDFYKPAHRFIFSAIQQLQERDNPLDMVAVEALLRDQGHLENAGGPAYLGQLTRSVSSAASIEYHCQIIREKALKRNLILSSSEIITQAYDAVTDPYDLIDIAEQKIFELANTGTRIVAKHINDILKNTLDHLVEIRGQTGGITGIPSGLDIDQLTAGWQKGDLIIVAARPSMGKTAFVLSITRNAALFPDTSKRTNVAFFSLEMSDMSLVQRMLTMEARINAQDARTGKLNDSDFTKLVEAAGRLHTAGIFIDETPSISVMELRSKCRRLKSEHDIGMVIIDYLQLMTAGPGFGNERNREQEIAYISRSLKALAKELNVPVIALSQLSRAVEQRGTSKKPQLSDLRESGSIEQDADVVLFLYRPEYYQIMTLDDGRSTAGVAEVIIGKQRNGPVGSKYLSFVKEYARFENLIMGDVNYGPVPGDHDSFYPDDYSDGSTKQRPPSLGSGFIPDDDEPVF
jgi:replicative DNA helicase